MDGNKKIIFVSIYLLFIFLLTACNVHKPTYVGLYVDDIAYTPDSVIIEDIITFDENNEAFTDDSLEILQLKDNKNSDSLYRIATIELLNNGIDSSNNRSITLDSVIKDNRSVLYNKVVTKGQSKTDSVLIKIDSLQQPIKQSKNTVLKKKDTVDIQDTAVIKKNKSLNGDNEKEASKKQLITTYDTIQQPKDQPQPNTNNFSKTDTLYTEDTVISDIKFSRDINNQRSLDDFRKQLLAKNDTIQQLKKQLNIISKSKIKTDTVVIEKTISHTGNENIEAIKKQLIAKNDTILQLRKQLNSQSKSITNTIIETDTIYIKDTVLIERSSSQKLNNQQNIEDVQKQLIAKNDTILQLLKQLKTQPQPKKNVIIKTDTIYIKDSSLIEKESSQKLNNQQKIEDVQKQLIAKNDTIQQLKNQLNFLSISKAATKTDTAVIENNITQNENIATIKKQLQAKNDSLLQLNKLLKSQPQPITKTITKTDTLFIENTAYDTIDTTLIVAYYKMGKVIPDSNIIGIIVNTLQNNKVQKIEISGYTDSSGNSYVNKKITNTRINYILSKISPLIATTKIFYQNFGNTLASKNIVPDERRVEIKIYYNSKD